MKKFQLIFSALATVALVGIGLSGCGDLDECENDGDCPGTEACYTGGLTNTCETSCGTEENPDPGACDAGEMCVDANESGNLQACVASGTGGDNDTGMGADTGMDMDGGDVECMENDDCPGENNICNPQGMCEMISTQNEHYFVQFKDVTLDQKPGEEAAACEGNSADDPGSDIFAIELQDSDGNNKGWAFYVANANAGSTNTHTNFATVFDGSEPTLMSMNGEQCVDFGTDTVASLGCQNGMMVAGFKTGPDAQDFVALEEGDQIVVHEYGDQCGGSDVDVLNAQVCTNQAATDFQGLGDISGDYPSCDNMSLGSGGGVFTLPVTSLPAFDNGS